MYNFWFFNTFTLWKRKLPNIAPFDISDNIDFVQMFDNLFLFEQNENDENELLEDISLIKSYEKYSQHFIDDCDVYQKY